MAVERICTVGSYNWMFVVFPYGYEAVTRNTEILHITQHIRKGTNQTEWKTIKFAVGFSDWQKHKGLSNITVFNWRQITEGSWPSDYRSVIWTSSANFRNFGLYLNYSGFVAKHIQHIETVICQNLPSSSLSLLSSRLLALGYSWSGPTFIFLLLLAPVN